VFLKHLKTLKFMKVHGSKTKQLDFVCSDKQIVLRSKVVRESKFGQMVAIIMETLLMELSKD